MTDFKQSETCLNLMRSFAGESQAHMRYKFFETRAMEEGLHEIEAIFKETAMNEMAHAHIFFKLLEKHLGSTSVPVNGEYPVELGNTLANLKGAAAGEHDEHTNVYPTFAETARKEGFMDVAHHFDMIAKIEQEHEQRFNHFANLVENGTLFTKDSQVYFKCIHCGHVHEGTSAPKVCPNCLHPQGFFKVVPTPWQ
ncbi:MAG: rubrerythrin [Cellulosilyticaceae bacterium]